MPIEPPFDLCGLHFGELHGLANIIQRLLPMLEPRLTVEHAMVGTEDHEGTPVAIVVGCRRVVGCRNFSLNKKDG